LAASQINHGVAKTMTNDDLSVLIANTDAQSLVTGAPGNWAFNPTPFILLSTTANLGLAPGAPPTPAPSGVAASQAQLVQQAVAQSNTAAVTTPAAATDTDVTSTTSPTVVSNALSIVTTIGDIGADISALEAGGTAHLHWWGWEATLNESATQALNNILGKDAIGVAAAMAALAPIIPVVAAISGVLGIVAAALDADITSVDKGKGVNLKGYLWVGLHVTAQ
jgi:hypothetical protein